MSMTKPTIFTVGHKAWLPRKPSCPLCSLGGSSFQTPSPRWSANLSNRSVGHHWAWHTSNIGVFTCVSSFSCSQVRMSDSLWLLSQILETDRFALVVQEPQQSNPKFSITSAEWRRPFVVEEKETSIPFYSVCLFSSIPDKSKGSADQEKMLSVVTAMELLSYITADREQGRSSCEHLPDTTTPSTPPRS